MSDRIRKAIGLILLLTGLLLITLPLLEPTDPAKRFYRATGNRYRISGEIPTEQNGSVRVNEADAETLQLLPGIGPAYAERIIAERRENGKISRDRQKDQQYTVDTEQACGDHRENTQDSYRPRLIRNGINTDPAHCHDQNGYTA